MPPEDPTEGTEPTEPTQPAEPTEPTSTEPKLPEYQNILESLPESLHPIVTPEIQKYSESQQAKIKEVQDQYDPWKPIAEQYELTDVEKRLQFSKAFEEDPVRVYNDLYQYLSDNNLLPEELQTPDSPDDPDSTEEDPDDDEDMDPAIKAMSEKLNVTQEAVVKVLENLQKQEQVNQQTQMQSELDAHLKEIDDKYPGVPRAYLLQSIAGHEDGMEAAKRFHEAVEAAAQQKLQPGEDAPPVIGGGGAPPSTKVDTKEAVRTREGRRELAMAILNNQEK